MAFLGADTDELREVGQEFEDGKEVVDQVITYLKALIALLRAASFFSGGASAAYAQYLESVVLPWLQKISMALGMFAKVLGSQADAQDQASEGGSVDYGSLPSYQTPAGLPAPITPYDGEPIVGGPQVGTPDAGATTTTTTVSPDGTTTTTTTTVPAPTLTTPMTGIDGSSSGAAGTGTTGGALGTGTVPAGATGGGTDAFPREGVTFPVSGNDALSGGGGGLSGGGSGGGTGGGTGGGSGSELGSSTIGSTDAGSVGGHSSPVADGGLGGATPGAEQLGSSSGLGSGPDSATPSSDNGTSYGAAAGIAGGAAALGLGGAALAGRTGGGGDPKIDSLAGSNGRGSSGAQVTELQERLTAAGYDTRGADGQWGPNTQAAFDAYRADNPLAVQAGSGYTSPAGYDYQQITGVKGNPNVTPEFLRGVEGMAQRLGAQPEHIMAAMSFETGGTFASDVRNPRSSATGLIQFMDSTAKGMGTTTSALAQMSPVEQLTYVEKYFEPHRGHLGDLESVYTSILAGHPASGNEALFTQGDRAYGPNRELDVNRNGVITAAEATAHVRSRMGS
ncbi:peptidoglycan-binding domain-containing protein [Nocardioides lijunqiniae]|uniref:peptidoglycan-binding domain-containing protein n=1 Tax=Nocardioides lijunqiniae TaxID=2760832 RepID=UPI0018781D26|nr:peptidoglycan-binding domain-containing protein [Nocardioides lijunqiniae]